ncbi:H-NS family nucleoid-associated regulatory protein [Burkholderia sp. 1B3(2022)]|uniref:H-NS family nucleoid-associated regulatory protein n=1 Tax=Burkholderia sp. 1B3(2022) TaxID=2997425 RepID=UPI003FA5BBD3
MHVDLQVVCGKEGAARGPAGAGASCHCSDGIDRSATLHRRVRFHAAGDFSGDGGTPGRKRRAKYFNPETGQTWSGVGREPAWIRGQDRSRFAIDAPPVDSNQPEYS